MADLYPLYIVINGVETVGRTRRGIKVSRSKISEGGDIVRLADGTRRSLRRVQFDKEKITISGTSARKPPIDGYAKGDTMVVSLGLWKDVAGDVAEASLPPHVAGSARWLGPDGAGGYAIMNHGDAGVITTSYQPTWTIMLDDVSVDDDLQNGSVTWTITGEEA